MVVNHTQTYCWRLMANAFLGKPMTRIYHHDSEDCPIEVWEQDNVRWLTFGDACIQSRIFLDKPYQLGLVHMEPMLFALSLTKSVKKILLLGLGAGGMVHYLQHFYPKAHITVVEMEPLVVDVAKQYFHLQESKQLTIEVMDANAFICTHPGLFDVILVDIFSAHTPANEMLEDAMFPFCRDHLTRHGAAAFNTVCFSQTDAEHIMEYGEQIFMHNSCAIPIKDNQNLIMLASNSKHFSRKLNRLCKAHNLRIQHNSDRLGIVLSSWPE